MLIRGLTDVQIVRAAERIGVRVANLRVGGRGWRFVIRTEGKPVRKYGRRSTHMRNKDGSQRRIPGAVCWHGHRDFMRQVFTVNPLAIIITGIARYNGSRHFEDTHRETGVRNIGSQVWPCYYHSACDCGVEEEKEEHALVATKVRLTKQADIKGCPHIIFAGEHYREDGTCRCDDPQHVEMKEWGYTWRDGRWR